MKKCTRCLEVKPDKMFSIKKKNKGGLEHNCKACRAVYFRGRRSPKVLYSKYKSNLLNKYGMKIEALQYWTDKQKGCCACCGVSLIVPESPHQFCIDHDHETLRVRGLLCKSCNTGIGLLGDSLQGLQKAQKYLRESL